MIELPRKVEPGPDDDVHDLHGPFDWVLLASVWMPLSRAAALYGVSRAGVHKAVTAGRVASLVVRFPDGVFERWVFQTDVRDLRGRQFESECNART